jgi:hypothetical protein
LRSSGGWERSCGAAGGGLHPGGGGGEDRPAAELRLEVWVEERRVDVVEVREFAELYKKGLNFFIE